MAIGKFTHTVPGSSFLWYSTMPICLDLGTITQKYLNYMGIRDRRVSVQDFMDEFLNKNEHCFPEILIHLRLAKNMLHVTIVTLIWNALLWR